MCARAIKLLSLNTHICSQNWMKQQKCSVTVYSLSVSLLCLQSPSIVSKCSLSFSLQMLKKKKETVYIIPERRVSKLYLKQHSYAFAHRQHYTTLMLFYICGGGSCSPHENAQSQMQGTHCAKKRFQPVSFFLQLFI